MRYLFLVLVLLGCTATDWRKDGSSRADLDRDYDECRQIAKPDPAIAAAFGAFGAIGVFAGVSTTDSKIRSCLQARGWTGPAASDSSATVPPAPAAAPASPVRADTIEPKLQQVKALEAETPASKRLRELKALLDQGLITKDEYEQKRQAVLHDL